MESFLRGKATARSDLFTQPCLHSPTLHRVCFLGWPLVRSPRFFSTTACEGMLRGNHTLACLQGKLQKLGSSVAALKPSACGTDSTPTVKNMEAGHFFWGTCQPDQPSAASSCLLLSSVGVSLALWAGGRANRGGRTGNPDKILFFLLPVKSSSSVAANPIPSGLQMAACTAAPEWESWDLFYGF